MRYAQLSTMTSAAAQGQTLSARDVEEKHSRMPRGRIYAFFSAQRLCVCPTASPILAAVAIIAAVSEGFTWSVR